MVKRLVGVGLAVLAALALTAISAAAQTLDEIKKSGVLVVGTKADYQPFGFRDPCGKIVGFEPDMAEDVADKLGVKLELVPVVSSNRMQFLQQGKIDLMIATMSDKPDRRKVVDIVEPNYYASGVNVLATKKAGAQELGAAEGQEGLRDPGRVVQQGAAAEKYGADVVAFKGTRRPRRRCVKGNCVGFVYDDTAFVGACRTEWDDFEMPLDDHPGGAVGPGGQAEERGAWGKFMTK